MRAFASVNDAYTKLNRSLITYKGILFKCDPFNNRLFDRPQVADNKLRLVSLEDRKEVIADYTEDAFQAVPYELGYLNDTKNLKVLFVYRDAVRHSNVGIDLGGLSYVPVGRKNSNQDDAILENNIIFSLNFIDMILNKYPSFDEAFDKVKKTRTIGCGCAFDKNYALIKSLDSHDDDYRIDLYHTFVRVASFNEGAGKFVANSSRRKVLLKMLGKSGIIPNEYL